MPGRRAHHRCSVDGWPWRIDFLRAEATLMASSGKATSMSFLGRSLGTPVDPRRSAAYFNQPSYLEVDGLHPSATILAAFPVPPSQPCVPGPDCQHLAGMHYIRRAALPNAQASADFTSPAFTGFCSMYVTVCAKCRSSRINRS